MSMSGGTRNISLLVKMDLIRIFFHSYLSSNVKVKKYLYLNTRCCSFYCDGFSNTQHYQVMHYIEDFFVICLGKLSEC